MTDARTIRTTGLLSGILLSLACLLHPLAAEEKKSVETLWEEGERAFAAGDVEGALKVFTEALETDRERPRTWSYLGGAHFRKGEYEKALLYFKQAFLLNPRDIRACNNIGTTYERLGQYEKAERYYLAALGIDGRYPVSYRNLGVLYAEQLGRPDRARHYWEQFLDLVPVGPDSDAVREQLELLGEGGGAGPGPGDGEPFP
jgi:tetratricopeptide (TPR) repeat protein